MFNIKEVMFSTDYTEVDMLIGILWRTIIRVENV